MGSTYAVFMQPHLHALPAFPAPPQRLLYAGHQLDDSARVGDVSGLFPSATLHLSYRLRGGGGDGGSTGAESRSCYLEVRGERVHDLSRLSLHPWN